MILFFYFPLILSLSLLLAEKQAVSDKALLCLTLFVLYYLPRTLFVLVSDRAGVCTLRCGRRPTGEPGRLLPIDPEADLAFEEEEEEEGQPCSNRGR